MKCFLPDYYEKFNCIADKCSFTCCRDWKITVDDNTLAVWKKTKTPKSMGEGERMLSEYVCRDFGGDRITNCETGKCPFLNEQGLCHIVKEYGEEMISQTCHTFPREEHEFSDRIEYTLTMGCPAALDLLWEKDMFSVTELDSEKMYAGAKPVEGGGAFCPNELFLFRDKCIELMLEGGLSVSVALKVIFFLALDAKDKFEEDSFDESYVNEIFSEKVLREVTDAVIAANTDEYDTASEQNELFLDLAENYRKKKIYSDVLEPLAMRAESYEDEDEDSYENTERLVAAKDKFASDRKGMEEKIRVLMAEELYSTLILPGSDICNLVIKLQWAGIFYAVLEAMLLLRRDINKKITNTDLTEIVTVLVRMTGYSDEDIEEYLEDSFEDLFWDWGYMALIVS